MSRPVNLQFSVPGRRSAYPAKPADRGEAVRANPWCSLSLECINKEGSDKGKGTRLPLADGKVVTPEV